MRDLGGLGEQSWKDFDNIPDRALIRMLIGCQWEFWLDSDEKTDSIQMIILMGDVQTMLTIVIQL